MTNTATATETALATLKSLAPDLSDWTAAIFDFGETAWREYRSAAFYVDILRRNGFTVEQGSGGMPTAFCADWRHGDGPVIGLYAEYDAVPGNCQQAAPEPGPRNGLSVLAGGHTDPHSGLGMAGLGAALAVKAAMQRHNLPGGIRFMGEPAEKVRGSKPIHAAKGYYDGLAGMLSFHPFYMLPLCNTVRWNTHCGAGWSMIYRFTCAAPESWGATDGAPIPQSHSDVRAPGATDALVKMYHDARYLRDSMLSHQGGWSISESILAAGQATADNLPGAQADLQYMMRVPTVEMAERVTARLDAVARAAAEATGCTVERHWVSKSRPGLANHAMARIVWDAMQAEGPPQWGPKAVATAQAVQQACGTAPTDQPFLADTLRLLDPEQAERQLRQSLPPNQANSTSDDYTDMTWQCPTARFYVARPTLAPRAGGPWPGWAMNALGGIPQTIDPMVQTAAAILARSGLRLIEDPAARAAAQQEFETRTGGGIGGSKWLPPQADYPPPVDFHWPEYVETARGRDWWIPTAR